MACLSAGPDGTAVATYSPALKKHIGGLAYGISLITLLWKWPKHRYSLTLTTDVGHQETLDCSAFYIIKGHYYAGNWTLVPDANLMTKHLYLLTLSSATRWQFCRFLAHIARNRDPARLKFVDRYIGRAVRIENGSDQHAQNVQIDGDPVDHCPQEIVMTDQLITYCLPAKD